MVELSVAPERRLILCGGPDIAVDGVRLHLRPPARRQATLALAYLLLRQSRPVPADELAEAVWPQGPPSAWRSGLRRVVSDVRIWLRSGEVDAGVRSAHGTYAIVLPTGVVTDVHAGRTALEAARRAGAGDAVGAEPHDARRAVDHLEAPLVPGADAPWLELDRREVERDLLEALDLLADDERRSGNPDAAVAAAERAVARDPLRESSYRQAIVAHRQAGRFGAALRAYERCRRTLAEVLGTTPSPATTTLYHGLLDVRMQTVAPGGPMVLLDYPGDAFAAAAETMQRLESRQAIAILEARLATIDATATPDPLWRVETLIELGRARWLVEGSTEALCRVSLAAGEAALSLGLARPFGDALALASTTTGVGQRYPDAVDLCRRGRMVFADDVRSQVEITGLEAELVAGNESIALAEQAVEGARAAGDERLLLDMLLVLDQSLAWTPDIARRLAIEEECNELLRRVPSSFRRRPTFEVMTRLQSADVEWLDEMDVRYPEGGRRTRGWELRVFLAAMRAVEATLVGDLPRAQRLATALVQQSGGELNSMHAAGGLLFALARETGGILGLVPAIEAIVESNPRIPAFRAALALGLATVGDRAGARDIVEEQARAGFDDVPHDHVYLLYLGLLAEAVALLDLPEHVGPLLDLVAPYEGQLCVGAHGLVVLNAMDSYRGMLATVTGDRRGSAWLAGGMAVEGRIRGVLLRARSATWRAAWLRRHGAPEDECEAQQLLAEARSVAAAQPDRAGLRAMVERLATPA